MSELKYGIIEVTTNCQLRCPGCYMVEAGSLNGNKMSLEQAVRVLDLCKEYRGGLELESMDILGGDPLLWPHLKKYIEELLRRGIKPWVFTNMLAIKPELAQWLFERRVYVTGKLNTNPCDSDQLALQAEMVGRSGKIASKMYEAIRIFLDAGYRSPMFKLENLVRRFNIKLVPQMYRWCLERNIDPDVELMGCGEGVTSGYWEMAPRPVEIAEMIRQIQQIRSEFGLEDSEVIMPHIFGRCRFFESGLYFGTDGHIRACSNSSKVLAYASDANPIKKAWESELFKCRHSLTRDRMGEPCGSCDRWDRCKGGCRATAEGSGDPFAGYELCPLSFLSSE